MKTTRFLMNSPKALDLDEMRLTFGQDKRFELDINS